MTRPEAIEWVLMLAQEFRQSDETFGAAGVLYALAGSLQMRQERAMLDHLRPFSQAQIAAIRALRDSSGEGPIQ